MARSVLPYVGLAALLSLAGCSNFGSKPVRPAWRDQAENSCLAEGKVKVSDFIRNFHEIDGPGICGLHHPFKVSALAGGTVTLNSDLVMACSMIPAMDEWIEKVVQPAALARFGVKVTAINSMGTYNCRPIDNDSSNKLSEHSFANAFDVGGFRLSDGRDISVHHDWNGKDEAVKAFLREVHAGACSYFTTVLGPGADVFHYNHLHFDLAMHGNTSTGPRRYCKPLPEHLPEAPKKDDLPDPPPIEEELDVSSLDLKSKGSIPSHSTPPAAPSALALHVTPVPNEESHIPIARPVTNEKSTSLVAGTGAAFSPAKIQSILLTPPVKLRHDPTNSPLIPTPPVRTGRMDENGVFDPEGTGKDWDVTSSIPHKTKSHFSRKVLKRQRRLRNRHR